MIMKLVDLGNPQFGTRISDISPIQTELYSQFCVQIPKHLLKENFTDSRSPLF